MSPAAPFKPPFPPNPPPGAPKPAKTPAPQPKPEPKPPEEQKQKPKWRPPEFLPLLRKKPVTVHLIGGIEIAGILAGWNNYELVIGLDDGREILVFKHAITHIDTPPDWRQLPEKEPQEAEEPAPPEPTPAEG